MFEDFKKWWNDYGFDVCTILAVTSIIILFIYNCITNKKGSYSTNRIQQNSFVNIDPPKDKFFNYRQHTLRDSKLELSSKYHLESMFNRPFFKIRPEFLKNEHTGKNLEIDLYNHELRLAVEIQGIQHYKFSPRFHLSETQFIEQKQRDNMKKLKCTQFGIKLIEVPYNIKEKDVRNFLKKELNKHGFFV